MLLNRGFYTKDVTASIHNRDIIYTMPIPNFDPDSEAIKNINSRPAADMTIKHNLPSAKEGTTQPSTCVSLLEVRVPMVRTPSSLRTVIMLPQKVLKWSVIDINAAGTSKTSKNRSKAFFQRLSNSVL